MDFSLIIHWSEPQCDIDVVVLIDNSILTSDDSAQQPIQLTGSIGKGRYTVGIASKTIGSPYRVSFQTQPISLPKYSDSPSLLQGTYSTVLASDSSSSVIHRYKFDGIGNYESWNYVSVDNFLDEWRDQAGVYIVQFPFLILKYDNQTDYYILRFVSDTTIQIDQTQYRK